MPKNMKQADIRESLEPKVIHGLYAKVLCLSQLFERKLIRQSIDLQLQ